MNPNTKSIAGQPAVKENEIAMQLEYLRNATDRLCKIQCLMRERFQTVLRREPCAPQGDKAMATATTVLGEELQKQQMQLHAVAEQLDEMLNLCELPK